MNVGAVACGRVFTNPLRLPCRARDLRMCAAAPLQTTVGSVHKVKPVPLVAHSDAPYANNHGTVTVPHKANQTMIRPRGYGLGNGINSKPFESGYYTQPGLSIDPRFEVAERDVRPAADRSLCLSKRAVLTRAATSRRSWRVVGESCELWSPALGVRWVLYFVSVAALSARRPTCVFLLFLSLCVSICLLGTCTLVAASALCVRGHVVRARLTS